jgi:hypothetical protein
VFEREHVLAAQDDVLGEAPVARAAEPLGSRTQRVGARAAPSALPAGLIEIAGDPSAIAGAAVAARGDLAGHFVPGDERKLEAGQCAVEDLQVGCAQADGANANEHLACGRYRVGNRRDVQR